MASKNPDPPDLGAQAGASERIARLNEEIASQQIAWAREQQTRNQQVMDDVMGITSQISGAALGDAARDRESFTSSFQPLEEQFAAEAAGYDTEARRAEAQAGAIADVGAQFDAQRTNALRRLEGYGIDPSMTRNQALDVGVRTAEAAAKAQAAAKARQQIENTGREFRGQAIQLGQNVAGRALTGEQQALAATGQGAQTQLTGSQVNAALPQSALPFSQVALQGQNQGAQIRLGQFGAQGEAADRKFNQAIDTVGALTDIAGAAVPFLPAADGGPVRRLANGGPAVGPGDAAINTGGTVVDPTGRSNDTGIDDQVPIRVSKDEYVIPADVVRVKGTEFFDKLVAKHHTPAAQQMQALPVGAV